MKKIIPSIGLMILFAAAINLRAAHALDWTAINPALEGATSVSDMTECLECHEDYMVSFEKTRHSKYFKHAGSGEGIVCERCHGPMSKHLAEAEDLLRSEKEPTVVSFSRIAPKQRNQVCLQCHESGLRMEWKGSAHEASGEVSCNSCHYVMERRSDRSLFISSDAKKACGNCHSQRRAQLMKSSHMPLREGKLDCSSCHNPHGSAGPKMLKTATVNETCYQCHAEKRGPFIWEHAPVNENCSTCHDPHGSNNPKLLLSQGAFLCTKCHSYGGHSSLLNSQFVSSNVSGGCVNCHSRIHGSNHPSGVRFQR